MTDIGYREGDTPDEDLAAFYQEHKDDPAIWEEVPLSEMVMPPQSMGEIELEPPIEMTVVDDGIDAWGISRDEWANRPTLETAHGAPRIGDGGLPWYDCRECEASYASLSGLLMHRNRMHISDAMKRQRSEKMSDAQKGAHARRKAEQKEAAVYVGEDPEVQEILARTRQHGTAEYEARRKRWSAAQRRGVTEGQFAAKELDRAIALAADPSIAKEPANKGKKEKTPKMAAPKDEAAVANELFERIGKATDILFPNGVTGAHVLQIAELQKDMLALMQGLAQ